MATTTPGAAAPSATTPASLASTSSMTPPAMTTVTFDEPLKRGDTEITSVQVRKPSASDLTGLKLFDVMQMDVDAMLKLLPRVTVPPIMANELRSMHIADFVVVSTEVVSFLGRKDALADSQDQ